MGLYVVRLMDEALAAATAETLIQVIAPATKRLQVVAWGISCDGVTASAVPENPVVAASGRIAIRATFAAIVNVTAWLRFKE